MYNVIIADDEKNIREGIVDLIEWEELECCVKAAMRNGEQVLDYLKKSEERIDLVITDIRMPIMDGMELAGVLQDTYPDISVIILTAYNDFKYAQQAVKYQVADFVVKNEFLQELPKAVERIIKKQNRRNDLSGKDEKAGWEREEYFSSIKEGECYRICACEIKRMNSLEIGTFPEDKVESLFETTFREYKTLLIPEEDNLFFFIIGQNERGDDSLRFRKKLEKLVSQSESFLNLQLRIGVSGMIDSTEHIVEGKKQALWNLSNICTDENPVNITGGNEYNLRQYWLDDADIDNYMRNLYVALRGEIPEERERMENLFLNYLKKEERSLEQCKSDTHSVISYLFRKIGNTDREERLAPEVILGAVYKCKTKAGLFDVLRETCSAVLAFFDRNKAGQNELIQSVQKIIEREYRGKLGLKFISQKLFVNSSYLSRIYKKETGITVTDAINEYRIKKAKEILATKKYKVYEVGKMVGIEDPAYFTHVFLKYEGQTPSDYMNKF